MDRIVIPLLLLLSGAVVNEDLLFFYSKNIENRRRHRRTFQLACISAGIVVLGSVTLFLVNQSEIIRSIWAMVVIICSVVPRIIAMKCFWDKENKENMNNRDRKRS